MKLRPVTAAVMLAVILVGVAVWGRTLLVAVFCVVYGLGLLIALWMVLEGLSTQRDLDRAGQALGRNWRQRERERWQQQRKRWDEERSS